MLGISLGSLIGGTVVIENLFDIPGIGYLLMDSIKSRIINHTRVCIVYRIFVVLINTIADVLTLLFDQNNVYILKIKNNSNVSSILESGDQRA